MNTIMKKTVVVILIFVMVSLFCSCNEFSDPPTVDDIEGFFTENEGYIQTVADYLLHIEYDYAYLYREDGGSRFLSNREYHEIEDVKTRESIKELFNKGCLFIGKEEELNSLHFRIWSKTNGNIDCGLSHDIKYEDEPKVQFQTELVPLNKDGWYYYLAEYEKWRSQHSDRQ